MLQPLLAFPGDYGRCHLSTAAVTAGGHPFSVAAILAVVLPEVAIIQTVPHKIQNFLSILGNGNCLAGGVNPGQRLMPGGNAIRQLMPFIVTRA